MHNIHIRPKLLCLAACLALSAAGAATISEDFSGNPFQQGWRIFGDTNLFQWDATNANLAITWDSSKTNSYFYFPLGTILTTNDPFSLEFDLRLTDATASNYGSELAVGFLHLEEAASTNFLRTSGTSPNVAEFDYFPPGTLAASVDATLIDASNGFFFAYDNVQLNQGTVYHVVLTHAANALNLQSQISAGGQLISTLSNVYGAATNDFRLDTVAISSYQDDGFGDSILAHGTVDNLTVTVPPPPLRDFSGAFSNGVWEGRFLSESNWTYTLERTSDFQSWSGTSTTLAGNGSQLILQDTNPPGTTAFYRIRATHE